MKTVKNKDSKLNPQIDVNGLKAVLWLSVLVGAGICVVSPFHFSIIAALIVIPGLVVLNKISKGYKPTSVNWFGAFFGMTLLILVCGIYISYAVTYGNNNGSPYSGSDNALQYIGYVFIEFLGSLFALVLSSFPLAYGNVIKKFGPRK